MRPALRNRSIQAIIPQSMMWRYGRCSVHLTGDPRCWKKASKKRSRVDWEALMARYEISDLTQREFCVQQGLAYSSFCYFGVFSRNVPMIFTTLLLIYSDLTAPDTWVAY
jgi:hypothetical protein